ncbi:glycosyltransferase family 4 protein [Nitratireductor kimnyeongensis]|uniref:Glycosyltransferase family 4 protein n=1 Tax=Nitratireductor kimnyeongensis TaxID=430679 RepID=A0ABW0TA38_9HYPH|nr:glycosyltransferase family 4 protein [Nitratireductor kimnyeongensis]QZZ36042.1 glycosyltransferase family 4 protein [Nitratireductor kimnyeongensis]
MSGKTPESGFRLRVRDVDVVAPNFKKRLSGVTSTIVQLVPEQSKTVAIAALGPGLPGMLPKLRWWQVPGLLRKPANRPFRIWHARRNTEMLAGVLLKQILRAPMKLVFTSAAQRHHSRYTKWLIRRMDAVVATSRRSGSFLRVPYKVVMHGVDTERFHPPAKDGDDWQVTGLPGRYGVGCFGRIRHQKGTDLFVAAMIELLPRYPDWTAVVLGRVTAENKGFAEELQRSIDQAGLSSRIVFLGEVSDVRPWFRRIDLCVAPSRNEGFGLTPLEAMASATATVASDAGAYEEMILIGETGEVAPAGDGVALKQAIQRYLESPELCRAHGRSALRHARSRFPLEGEANALNALYKDLWREART